MSLNIPDDDLVLEAFRRGGREAMEELSRLSGAEVPLDQGDLDRSRKVTIVDTPDGFEGAVSYDTVYAARQHEEITWQHDTGRKAKYLGDPFRLNEQRLQQHIADAVKDVLGG
ncbi:hypothetical protein [Prauserella endophytica]|uniref:HK97 gp10 family phage protein n=1 Tax=Prauserella endophytica TaxID=1592324 RepID=A0ABY2RZW7_9PSEU|nr:hypothetical protein [Prauserella endophytica]PXY20313.1 hypothetical protein BAY59_31225 [Prauserella coralliicola]TKG66915.1 hypothetical protein FCN18_23670 [Prauserella endophytica]